MLCLRSSGNLEQLSKYVCDCRGQKIKVNSLGRLLGKVGISVSVFFLSGA